MPLGGPWGRGFNVALGFDSKCDCDLDSFVEVVVLLVVVVTVSVASVV